MPLLRVQAVLSRRGHVLVYVVVQPWDRQNHCRVNDAHAQTIDVNMRVFDLTSKICACTCSEVKVEAEVILSSKG